ncbi:MAG: response regulator [Planctomycetota bacterium]|nr:MAG: response regulator [Planctomycetota bacterium]
MGRKKILFADRDANLARKINLFLTEEGYDVTWVDKGVQVLQFLDSQQWDILIIEKNLPLVDGIGIMKYCYQFLPDLPVILTTSSPSLDAALQVIRYRGWDYLIKPFSLVYLLKRIEEGLEKKSMKKAQKKKPKKGKNCK